jgi:hypothetical protein
MPDLTHDHGAIAAGQGELDLSSGNTLTIVLPVTAISVRLTTTPMPTVQHHLTGRRPAGRREGTAAET